MDRGRFIAVVGPSGVGKDDEEASAGKLAAYDVGAKAPKVKALSDGALQHTQHSTEPAPIVLQAPPTHHRMRLFATYQVFPL